MSSEIVGPPPEESNTEIPQETERDRPPVDAYAATRSLERMLGIDLNNPDARTPGLPPDWKKRARVAGTIIYHRDGETYEGFGQAEPSVEDKPILPDEK